MSPQNDNGYDVADYYKIDPAYGTMEDLEELIREADKRGIGLMLEDVYKRQVWRRPKRSWTIWDLTRWRYKGSFQRGERERCKRERRQTGLPIIP